MALEVKNNRDSQRGGQTARVGTIYASSQGMYGGPDTWHGREIGARSPETVAATVDAATADALAHAGVSVKPGGPTLVASVKEFWMEGHVLHDADILVSYDLTDHASVSLWHAEVRGRADLVVTFGNILIATFRAALSDLAQHASEAFQSSEFQTALASLRGEKRPQGRCAVALRRCRRAANNGRAGNESESREQVK